MKKTYLQKGFTLIELLVVIAIIGILSSIVLASLSTARQKGRAASIQGSMTSMRAQAELGVDSSGTYVADLCLVGSTANAGSLYTLVAAATSQSAVIICNQNTASGVRPTAWAAQADLNSLGITPRYFCVDSSGAAGARTGAISAGTAAVNTTCPAS